MNERDRILQVMQSSGMNAKNFCQEVGISPGTLSNITGGRNKPSLDVLQAILRRFRGISCDWLVMGVGTMYINGTREEGVLSLFDVDSENKSMPLSLPSTSVVAPATVTPINKLSASTPQYADALSSTPRTVSKIMIFYSDGTFEER